MNLHIETRDKVELSFNLNSHMVIFTQLGKTSFPFLFFTEAVSVPTTLSIINSKCNKTLSPLPQIVENMIGKVMEEFEHRLAGQNEQVCSFISKYDVTSIK